MRTEESVMRAKQWICLLWFFEAAVVCPASAKEFAWLNDVEKGMAEAKQSGQAYVLYFTADW